MPTHSFKIFAGIDTKDSRVELDGKPITGVSRVAFEIKPGGFTTLTLDVMGEILVEGEFRESAILAVRQRNPE